MVQQVSSKLMFLIFSNRAGRPFLLLTLAAFLMPIINSWASPEIKGDERLNNSSAPMQPLAQEPNPNSIPAPGQQPVAVPAAETVVTPSAEPSPSAAKPLTGRISGTRLLGSESLSQLGNTTENLKKSCMVVMSEVTRQESVPARGPNVVGATVIPAIPNPSGMVYMGHMDPRPKVLAGAINTIIAYSKRLEDQIATTVIPTDAPGYAKELWDKIREISEKLHADLFDLANLVRNQNVRYSIGKIEKLTLSIYNKSEAMNKLRNRILPELHGQK